MSALKRIINFFRPALILLAVFLAIGLAGVAFQGIRTLQRLTAVEAERDQWQRPADVIKSLDLKNGSVVVDFGSGAGYFALKLSDTVGPSGRVLAVDLRRLSLFFLRVRTFLQKKYNVSVIVGDVDDPHLPAASADAVLIANTFHELSVPETILTHVSQTLHSGGRLVILDRLGNPGIAETQLRKAGFILMDRQAPFIRRPGDEQWWLIVANKP